MDIRDHLASIVERLEEIEKVLSDHSAAVRAKHERDKANPQSVRAEITFDDTSKREASTEANRQNATQEKIGRYAFYAFLAAIFYAGISALQLYETRVQTAQVFHQSEVENANAAGATGQLNRQLDIAQKQAKAAQESVSAITKQMRQDQRAWIEMGQNDPMTFTESKPFMFILHLTNIGKTAARNLDTEAIVERVSIKSEPTLSFKRGIARAEATVGVEYPDDHTMTVPAAWQRVIPGGVEFILPSKTDVQEFENGDTYFVVYARTKYLDIFNTPHISKFCKFYSTNTKSLMLPARKCTDYNGVDNN